MLFSQKSSLEDSVVERLLGAPSSVQDLAETLGKKRGVSLRGIYRAVEALIRAGVLTKSGKKVRVDGEWLKQVELHIATPGPTLSPGERSSYTFSSVEHLDKYWTTLAFELERSERKAEIFFYNPHNFWAYIQSRREAERAYYAHFAKENRFAFFTIGGETQADRECKREFQSEHLQIDLRPIAEIPRNTHITLLGDYVLTARIPTSLAQKIDRLYASNAGIDDLYPELEPLCAHSHFRLVLENNPKRAADLRKKLSKNFYFKGFTAEEGAR